MAPRKKRAVEPQAPSDPLHKIAGLLAILVTKEMETDDAARLLEGAGFSDPEISGILGTSEGYMRKLRFNARNAKKRRK